MVAVPSLETRNPLRGSDLSELVARSLSPEVTVPVVPLAPHQVQYTNAKVLLVGESGAGKTGLSKRFWLPKMGAERLTVGVGDAMEAARGLERRVEREIWLWDFGGQADQRLIHQLYMDETALAVLVFDRPEAKTSSRRWASGIATSPRAARGSSPSCWWPGGDAGGLTRQPDPGREFRKERGFAEFLETSAKRSAATNSSRPPPTASTGTTFPGLVAGALQAAQGRDHSSSRTRAGC